jgi:Rrf2 family protein
VKGFSQKCQYALRAVLELYRRQGSGPVRVADIARAEGMPPKFLELILGELRRAGLVQSRRGVRGGYMLLERSVPLTVGEVVRLVDGPISPVQDLGEGNDGDGALRGHDAFRDTWHRARDAMAEVLDSVTFADLLAKEQAALAEKSPNYMI